MLTSHPSPPNPPRPIPRPQPPAPNHQNHWAVDMLTNMHLVPGVASEMPGVRCQVPGARCQVPGARRQVPGARVLPGARLNAHGSPIHPPTPPRPSARARAPEVGPCVLEANHATPPPARNPPATKPLYSNPPPLPPTLEPLGGGSPFHPWNPWAPGRKPGAHRPRGGAASSPAPAPLPAPRPPPPLLEAASGPWSLTRGGRRRFLALLREGGEEPPPREEQQR